ncbi:DMT family transporter [Maridesulfovibrio sp.]|uniref:DMT family transporter n=1 Tax=Maridesulfovibrio sp. TaxID=2795000 RepID=UPI002A189313|nr:DMT family transporter [Maridesulfovibrio sp.]
MIKAYVNLILAMVIVGSSVVAGKIMVSGLPVFLSSGLRFLLASVIIVPVLFYLEGGLPRLSIRSLMILVVQALCGSFLFTVCLLFGLRFVSPASAGIITSTTPAFMGVIGWTFFREKCSALSCGGIVLSFAGILVLSVGQEGGSSSLIGLLLVLGAVVAESMFLVFRKWINEPLSPLAATALISFFGLLWFLPASLYEYSQCDLSAVPFEAWVAVCYYGAVVTVLAYLCWFAGVVRVKASVAGAFTGIMPVSAVLLSSLVLGEELRWFHLCGCVLVCAGILFSSGFFAARQTGEVVRAQ